MVILRDSSQPNTHQHNDVHERSTRTHVDVTRAARVQAGLPPCVWPLAGNHYTMSTTIADPCTNDEGCPIMSAWCARTGSENAGQVMPLGAVVMCSPTPEHITTSEAGPQLTPGVLVGCRLTSGAHWSGEYLVYDLNAFANTNLAISSIYYNGRPSETTRWKDEMMHMHTKNQNTTCSMTLLPCPVLRWLTRQKAVPQMVPLPVRGRSITLQACMDTSQTPRDENIPLTRMAFDSDSQLALPVSHQNNGTN